MKQYRIIWPLVMLATLGGVEMLHAQDLEKLQSAVAPVMALSDNEVLELIPERAGLRFTGCPNCTGGTQENQLWWTIQEPHTVYCQHCDLRYPNDLFPDDQTLSVINSRGETHAYPYWDDADGYHHFFQAKGWYVAREYFQDAARWLAELYAATGEENYARRSALILRRFAEVYPGYLVHYDYPFRQKILWAGEEDFPYPVPDFRAAKWSWWAYMDISEDLLKAYEVIRDSGALNAEDQRLIETDLFHAMVGFIHNYEPALTNMDPTLLRSLIWAGQVLHEPDYIHDAVHRIGLLTRQQFFADGAWREGAVSYHNQTTRGLGALVDLLDGYSDPPGYKPDDGKPWAGARFDHFDMGEQLPILARARQVPNLLRYPNGRVVAFHDTWAREGMAPTQRSTSSILPELGHAWLGRGEGDGQIQTHLHFSGGYGHQHRDVLGMTLFARGQERLGDMGYTHTRYRAWTLTTLSHNTVTVDGIDQQAGSLDHPSDGALTLFVPGDGDLLAVVEARGERAYPDLVDEYKRMLVQIGAGDDAYVVDLFSVVGGSRHEYVLTGDADHDGALEHDLPMQSYGPMLLPEGVDVKLPTGESTPGEAGDHNLGYAFLRDVQQVPIDAAWTVTFASDAAMMGAVKVHGTALGSDDILFSAQAPSVRRAQNDDAVLDQFTMPVLVHRRDSSDGEALVSRFVTVLETVGEGGAFVDGVERLEVEAGSDGVAVRVTWNDTVDLLLVAADANSTVRVADVELGDVELQGRLGFVRMRGEEVVEMRLVGGTKLSAGGRVLEGHGVQQGLVTSTKRRETGDDVDALVTNLVVSQVGEGAGLWAIVAEADGFHHGHQIVAVEGESAAITTLVLANDPGYVVAGVSHKSGDRAKSGGSSEASAGGEMAYFPGRSWQGETVVEIVTKAAWSAPR